MYIAFNQQETCKILSLKSIQFETQNNPKYALIWLHGLGASGHDFIPIIEELNLSGSVSARFIFPHAPIQSVSLNNGIQMPAWFDIYGLDENSKEDTAGIKAISKEIDQLIAQQIERGIHSDRIILAGFSQGGALALYTGLHSSFQLAGLLGISCYLPIRNEQLQNKLSADQTLPIFLAHGLYDDVVSIKFAQHTRMLLEQENFCVQWKDYPCGHSVHPNALPDIKNWLLKLWQQNS